MPFTYFASSSHPQHPAYALFWLPRAKLDAPPQTPPDRACAEPVVPSSASAPQLQSVTNACATPELRTTPAPAVPARQCPPFVPTIKTFHHYIGEWESDSDDDVLTEDQRAACDKRFAKEDAQVERHASRFAAITPAFGHKVLPQHERLPNKTQEI